MADFIELDFLGVETDRSGDAITVSTFGRSQSPLARNKEGKQRNCGRGRAPLTNALLSLIYSDEVH